MDSIECSVRHLLTWYHPTTLHCRHLYLFLDMLLVKRGEKYALTLTP